MMTDMRIEPGAMLGIEYHNKNLPVAEERMRQAGLRLAWVLNEAFQ
jgi:hypothetical protein